MKRILYLISPILIAVVVFLLITFIVNRKPQMGALQVTSSPVSDVYLNGKLIGQTPLCKCDLPNLIQTGDYTLKLVPKTGNFQPFEQKVTVSPKIITVVDRTFAPSGLDQASILTFEPLSDSKDSQISVVTFPSKAQVFLDNNVSGLSPLLLQSVTASDHELKVTKDGYKDKIVKISTKVGYKLDAVIYMGVNSEAQPSGTPSAKTTPTPTKGATQSGSLKQQITILETPTGFLRVRQDPSVGSAQVGQVNPGEKYNLLNEQTGWYQIKLKDGTVGWVSSQYASKS